MQEVVDSSEADTQAETVTPNKKDMSAAQQDLVREANEEEDEEDEEGENIEDSDESIEYQIQVSKGINLSSETKELGQSFTVSTRSRHRTSSIENRPNDSSRNPSKRKRPDKSSTLPTSTSKKARSSARLGITSFSPSISSSKKLKQTLLKPATRSSRRTSAGSEDSLSRSARVQAREMKRILEGKEQKQKEKRGGRLSRRRSRKILETQPVEPSHSKLRKKDKIASQASSRNSKDPSSFQQEDQLSPTTKLEFVDEKQPSGEGFLWLGSVDHRSKKYTCDACNVLVLPATASRKVL